MTANRPTKHCASCGELCWGKRCRECFRKGMHYRMPKGEQKMTNYKCGHESNLIITNSNPLSISAWLEWKETVGFEGDKSECFECWCEEDSNKEADKYGY